MKSYFTGLIITLFLANCDPTTTSITSSPTQETNNTAPAPSAATTASVSTLPPGPESTHTLQPIQFLNLDGSPAALRPVHIWVILFSIQSYLESLPFGAWRARFIAPAGAK